jgi:hypothetical protein
MDPNLHPAFGAIFALIPFVSVPGDRLHECSSLVEETKKMADVQVTCITKPYPQSLHEHITHLGNPVGNWKWTREQVIASIDAKSNTFFVVDPRKLT